MLRDVFFEKLNNYKKVDSGGRHKNNIGGSVEDKHQWLQDYKFNLCFENSSFPGYLTEKLFDAYDAGCVPIYWGDTSLRIGVNAENGGYDFKNPEGIDMRIPAISEEFLDYKINPKAIINAHNFPDLNALLEEVKRIDNDDAAFEAMRREPLFLNGFDPKPFYEQKLLAFFDRIFSEGKNLSARRGYGQRLTGHRDKLRNNAQLKKDFYAMGRRSRQIARLLTPPERAAKYIIKKLIFWHKW